MSTSGFYGSPQASAFTSVPIVPQYTPQYTPQFAPSSTLSDSTVAASSSFLYSRHIAINRLCLGGFEVTDDTNIAFLTAKYEGCFTKHLEVRDGFGKGVASIRRVGCGGSAHAVTLRDLPPAVVRKDPRSCFSNSLVCISGVTGVITHEMRPLNCWGTEFVVLRADHGARPGSGTPIAKAWTSWRGIHIACGEELPELETIILMFLTRMMIQRERKQAAAASRQQSSL